jgi:hypothetical protein
MKIMPVYPVVGRSPWTAPVAPSGLLGFRDLGKADEGVGAAGEGARPTKAATICG